jgi:hypothetical protein
VEELFLFLALHLGRFNPRKVTANRQGDGDVMREGEPPLKTTKQIAGQGGEEMVHGHRLESKYCLSQLRVTFISKN